MFWKYFVSEIMLARNHMFRAGDDVESVFRVDDWDARTTRNFIMRSMRKTKFKLKSCC